MWFLEKFIKKPADTTNFVKNQNSVLALLLIAQNYTYVALWLTPSKFCCILRKNGCAIELGLSGGKMVTSGPLGEEICEEKCYNIFALIGSPRIDQEEV